MAYDLEEQEQIDEFKAWWKQYGKLLTNVVLAVLVGYLAWQAWLYYQNKQAAEASGLYQTLSVVPSANIKDIKAQSSKLMDKYASTPYAGRAAILAAKANYAANDNKGAKEALEWAVKNAKEPAVQAMASIELAGILAEDKNYDAALKVLAGSKDFGFSGLNADLRGDIYAAQGKVDDAKKAYEEALTKLDEKGQYVRYTNQKLEALG